MKKYTTVFFDLDNTLLDFNKSEYKAIKSLLVKHNLPDGDDVAKLYSEINLSFWQAFERGDIKKEEIFEGRFKKLSEALNRKADTAKMAADYFGFLADGHDTVEGAFEILEWTKSKGIRMYATTNGIAKTQYKRVRESGLESYFDEVFVSENAGHQKPEKEYFEYVLSRIPEKNKANILIVGDSQTSDILGGLNSGIDTCWYNPDKISGKYYSLYEISELKELKKIMA